ncbi:hypothetical protein F4V43_11505 [Paenibacillus spiritus]|uniref:YgiT-type zinc finger protein n=1 Tax=Paenibacillus spiritus TaxID=2496557 RepID=A0A5J5G8J1_9BACL|nr:hypothetical protein [Paenibacillus spiritus]KAA9004027.1 hypothetical protein F4V43_11505 [Paenibacillus spiritus]
MSDWSRIQKRCGCGAAMMIHMHTLIYKRRVQIAEVPVYSCARCGIYEPVPMIRQELMTLLAELNEQTPSGSLSFAERSEWAAIVRDTLTSEGAGAAEEEGLGPAIQQAVQGRIDLLLDLYRFAFAAGEATWMAEIERRLSSLTGVALNGMKMESN